MKKNFLVRTGAAGMAAMMLGVMLTATPVMAAGQTEDSTEMVVGSGITMYTSYPGLTVKAGDTATFALNFTNATSSGETMELSASSKDGLEGYFTGSSNTVNSVYVPYGNNQSLVTYTVNVPDDTQDGTYHITLTAKGANHTSTVNLTLQVQELDLGASTLKAETDKQSGDSSSSLSYSLTLQNNSLEAQTFKLSADGAPKGWKVAFADSNGSSLESVDVDPVASTSIKVTVTPSSDASAGDFKIPVKAASDSENLEQDLTATITGTYNLGLTTQSGTLSFKAKANNKTPVVLDITNSGNDTLNNINLTATAATDWTVEFSESTIDSLAAGETKEVTAYVTPASSAISGDYAMTIKASADEANTSNQFRVTVETQTVWGIVGIIIILGIAAALIAVFNKYGRH